jgi:hypothetical protein
MIVLVRDAVPPLGRAHSRALLQTPRVRRLLLSGLVALGRGLEPG